MGTRRKAREAALQMLFQMDASGAIDAEPIIELYWKHLGEGSELEEFANALVRGFAEKRSDVDERIRAASDHWRLERMTHVDRNILRLGAYELLDLHDVPRRVTLNEAVELAKRFGTEASPGFVNGILDRIASELGKE